jgi:hypothetical protein
LTDAAAGARAEDELCGAALHMLLAAKAGVQRDDCGLAVAVASSILLMDEGRKLAARLWGGRRCVVATKRPA